MKTGTVLRNRQLQNDYYEVEFHAPEIAAAAQAGQFVHVRIDHQFDRILRRPFSIHDVSADGGVCVVYKIVGTGTQNLARIAPGESCDLLGPLGKAYTPSGKGVVPVLVAGGYGAAACYMLTRTSAEKGVLLLGARSKADVILADRYREAGYDVRIATDDGSLGMRGRVTGLLEPLLRDYAGRELFFYGCGPHPMLLALARFMRARSLRGELSIDHLMCCGVGACFSCVVKLTADNANGWRYARACLDGPVFPAEDIYLEG